MKLLGWMNRKMRQNNIELPQKQFLHGISTKPSLYTQELYLNQASAPENPRQQDERIHEVEKSYFLHDGSFDGFLTIGTLGLDPSNTDPPTPTFAMPTEKIREQAIDAAKVELQLVNEELIKFLEEENKEKCIEMKECENMTCKRNICTLNREENRDTVTLPLQAYLFASSIDLPHTSEYMKKEKVSLRQLFEASNSACVHSTKKCTVKEKKDMRSYTKPFLKKIMNKLHPSSKSNTAHAADKPAVAPPSTKTKLSKALTLFNKKVHPERSGEEKKTEKYYNTNDAKSNIHNNSDYTFQLNHTYKFPVKPMFKNKTSSLELETQKVLEKGDPTQNKEYWIRTDSDCKKLSFSFRVMHIGHNKSINTMSCNDHQNSHKHYNLHMRRKDNDTV